MRYFVDIDWTIAATPQLGSSWDYKKSQPMLCRIKKLNDLFDEGHEIIYWTARGSNSGYDWYELTVTQLLSWGCKFHELRMGKPSFDVFIDDKAIAAHDFFGKDSQ